MGEEEKIIDYVSKMQKLIHLMKDCGKTLIDKIIVKKIMCTLTSHFDHVIVVIKESNNLEILKLEDLVCLLKAYKMRIVEMRGIEYLIQAL